MVSMPIMAPLADVLGVTRQTAVSAFQFGDGLSNLIWPHLLHRVRLSCHGQPAL